jgi:NAD(P)-dependent dehydrogenase (short-subunit alcohol dehydrogenase family)
VVVQTSCVHRGGSINFSDIGSERSYSPWRAYKQSKVATLLFARELDRRLQAQGIGTPVCVACHPGLVDTALYRNSGLVRRYLRPFMHGIDDGIQPALRACLDPAVGAGSSSARTAGWNSRAGR